MFQSPRGPGNPKWESNRAGNVNGERSKSSYAATRDERRERWQEAAVLVAREFGAVYPQELGSVLTGLVAFGVAPIQLVGKGRQPMDIPIIKVGQESGGLSIRSEQQRMEVDKTLLALKVPLAFRLAYITELGIRQLNSACISKIGETRIRAQHPAFYEQLTRIYSDVYRDGPQVGDCDLTAEERPRRERNNAAASCVKDLVNEFSKSHHAKVGVELVFHQELAGEPITLTIQTEPKREQAILQDLRRPARDLLFAERRAVLARFGAFLGDRFRMM